MKKLLIIIRGIPGSGKSTLAKTIAFANNCIGAGPFEADNYMVDARGHYVFDPKRLRECHERCRNDVENAMIAGKPTIVQSNTNIRRAEMQPYFDLAERYGYEVQEIIVKANFGSVHGVPAEKLAQMRSNFQF